MEYSSIEKNHLQVIQDQLNKQSEILKEIQNKNAATRYLNAREAAAYVGISERLFNERLKLGMWTNYRVGRRRVFRPCDLDADLQAFQEQSRYRNAA
jgi:hypothetical protein